MRPRRRVRAGESDRVLRAKRSALPIFAFEEANALQAEGTGVSVLQARCPHWSPATEDDLRVVEAQIGRKPSGVLGVARRCAFGYPQVIATHPLPGRKPQGTPLVFPTLFWLTCPMLRAAIGRLEASGWIGRLAGQVEEDNTLRTALAHVHARAAELRRALLGPQALAELRSEHEGRYQVVATSGVAGIRSPHGVKCLHAHFADHLALGGNPIGERVAHLLEQAGVDPSGRQACPSACQPAWQAPRADGVDGPAEREWQA